MDNEPVSTDNSETVLDDNASQSQGTSSWIEGLSPELRENPNLTKFKSADDLAKSWVDVQRLIGKEKIPVPSEDAQKEDWDIVYDRLGRPKEASEYKLPEVELPEGLGFDENKANAFKEKAHELGLNQAQIEGLYQYYAQDQITSYNQQAEEFEKTKLGAEKELRQEWGTAYNEKLQLADRALKAITENEEDYKEARAEIGNNPKWIKRLQNIGAKMSEDSLGDGNARTFSRTPESAKAEIPKLQKKLMSMDALDPERKLIKEQLDVAYREAYPDVQDATTG